MVAAVASQTFLTLDWALQQLARSSSGVLSKKQLPPLLPAVPPAAVAPASDPEDRLPLAGFAALRVGGGGAQSSGAAPAEQRGLFQAMEVRDQRLASALGGARGCGRAWPRHDVGTRHVAAAGPSRPLPTWQAPASAGRLPLQRRDGVAAQRAQAAGAVGGAAGALGGRAVPAAPRLGGAAQQVLPGECWRAVLGQGMCLGCGQLRGRTGTGRPAGDGRDAAAIGPTVLSQRPLLLPTRCLQRRGSSGSELTAGEEAALAAAAAAAVPKSAVITHPKPPGGSLLGKRSRMAAFR